MYWSLLHVSKDTLILSCVWGLFKFEMGELEYVLIDFVETNINYVSTNSCTILCTTKPSTCVLYVYLSDKNNLHNNIINWLTQKPFSLYKTVHNINKTYQILKLVYKRYLTNYNLNRKVHIHAWCVTTKEYSSRSPLNTPL